MLRLFYGSPTGIRLVAEDGYLCRPVEGPDGTIINGERVDSSKGGQQGCAMATYMCMAPVKACMRVVQKKHPKVRIINFADDAYTNADQKHLYPCIGLSSLYRSFYTPFSLFQFARKNSKTPHDIQGYF